MNAALTSSGRHDLPELPEAMRGLDRDHRGYPIPFIVARGVDGKPDFRINDARKVEMCLWEGLCAVSGRKLQDNDVWFVGGPKAAYHPLGGYLDPPAMKVCLVWALRVCPFLVARRYTMKDNPTPRFTPTQEMGFKVNPAVDPDAPDMFVLARTDGISLVEQGPGQYVLLPNRPWLEVEHWRAGSLIEVRRRAQTLKELRAWKDTCTEDVPISARRRNRGDGPKTFPWSHRHAD